MGQNERTFVGKQSRTDLNKQAARVRGERLEGGKNSKAAKVGVWSNNVSPKVVVSGTDTNKDVRGELWRPINQAAEALFRLTSTTLCQRGREKAGARPETDITVTGKGSSKPSSANVKYGKVGDGKCAERDSQRRISGTTTTCDGQQTRESRWETERTLIAPPYTGQAWASQPPLNRKRTRKAKGQHREIQLKKKNGHWKEARQSQGQHRKGWKSICPRGEEKIKKGKRQRFRFKITKVSTYIDAKR